MRLYARDSCLLFLVIVAGFATPVAQAQTTYKVLHSFTNGADGAEPLAALIRDTSGSLYGTTFYGGTSSQGTVFKVDPSGQETVLYSFNFQPDGGNPESSLVLDSAGNLYGTTYFGGAFGAGSVFKVDATGKETVLYNFTGQADGGNPLAGLLRDSLGNLYGTTYFGGDTNSYRFGYGVVFKLDRRGNESVLYTFTDSADGGFPQSAVVRDAAGNLYGVTYEGGTYQGGTVFKLDPTGKETGLYSFLGGFPNAVLSNAAGNLIGTTNYGGDMNGCGSRGCGTVFKMDSTGAETVLYSFTGLLDGSRPYAGVIGDAAGNLYGTTWEGGTYGYGTVFKLDKHRKETVLYSFTGSTDGASPVSGLVRDAAGNLYGTTQFGGSAGLGTVFELTFP